METETQKLTLNVEEAAKKLNVSAPTLRAAIRRGEIPAIKIGARRVIIPVAALERYLANAGAVPCA